MGVAAAAAPPPEPPPAKGFFESLINLYFAPGEAFSGLLGRPNFWVPLALSVALGVGFSAIWLQKVDAGEFVKQQLESMGRWDKIPEDTRARILADAPRSFARNAWLGAVLGAPILYSILAAVFLLVFRFFYGADVDFKRSLTIVACAFAAVAIVATPLTLAVLSLKGDWNINPEEALQANLTLLLERATTAKPLYALAGSFDLVSFWRLFLVAAGFGAAARKSVGWALPGVLAPWALYVLAKAGLAAIF